MVLCFFSVGRVTEIARRNVNVCLYLNKIFQFLALGNKPNWLERFAISTFCLCNGAISIEQNMHRIFL
jgi:hypothetical protein